MYCIIGILVALFTFILLIRYATDSKNEEMFTLDVDDNFFFIIVICIFVSCLAFITWPLCIITIILYEIAKYLKEKRQK